MARIAPRLDSCISDDLAAAGYTLVAELSVDPRPDYLPARLIKRLPSTFTYVPKKLSRESVAQWLRWAALWCSSLGQSLCEFSWPSEFDESARRRLKEDAPQLEPADEPNEDAQKIEMFAYELIRRMWESGQAEEIQFQRTPRTWSLNEAALELERLSREMDPEAVDGEQTKLVTPAKKRRNSFAKVEALIGKLGETDEKAALRLMVDSGGSMPYADFLTSIGYEGQTHSRSQATQRFGSLKTRLNKKLDGIGWLFDRNENEIVLKRKRSNPKPAIKKSRKSNSR